MFHLIHCLISSDVSQVLMQQDAGMQYSPYASVYMRALIPGIAMQKNTDSFRR